MRYLYTLYDAKTGELAHKGTPPQRPPHVLFLLLCHPLPAFPRTFALNLR